MINPNKEITFSSLTGLGIVGTSTLTSFNTLTIASNLFIRSLSFTLKISLLRNLSEVSLKFEPWDWANNSKNCSQNSDCLFWETLIPVPTFFYEVWEGSILLHQIVQFYLDLGKLIDQNLTQEELNWFLDQKLRLGTGTCVRNRGLWGSRSLFFIFFLLLIDNWPAPTDRCCKTFS